MSSAVAGPQWRGLIAVQFISMGAMEMSNPFWPLHLRALAADDGWLALAGVGTYVLPMLGMVLTSVWWGRLGDRHGHKWMMVRALAGLAVTQLALAASTGVAEVLAWRLLQGMLAGFIAPAQAYGVALARGVRPYALFAALQTATNLGSLLGATAGGLLWERLPFAWLNSLAALLCAACACAVAIWLPDVRSTAAAPAQPDQAAAGARQASLSPAAKADARSVSDPVRTEGCASSRGRVPLAGLIAVLGLLIGARMVTQVPFSLYAAEILSMGKQGVGLSYGLMALGFVAMAATWARHFEGLADLAVLRRQLLVTTGLVLLTGGLSLVREAWAFGLLQFCWGGLIAASTPVLTALISRWAGSAQRGRVLGWVQSATQLCSIAGIGVGGLLLRGGGLGWTYACVAFIYMVGLAALAWLLWRACTRLRQPVRLQECDS